MNNTHFLGDCHFKHPAGESVNNLIMSKSTISTSVHASELKLDSELNVAGFRFLFVQHLTFPSISNVPDCRVPEPTAIFPALFRGNLIPYLTKDRCEIGSRERTFRNDSDLGTQISDLWAPKTRPCRFIPSPARA